MNAKRPNDLPPRLMRVIAAIASGRPGKQCAVEMGVTYNTFRTYTRHAYTAIGFPRWAGGAVRKGCKHLIILFILSILSFPTFADSAPSFVASVPTANSQDRRLAALSMIESGDDDTAIGRAGEVSRFQILPAVWRRYAGYPPSFVARSHALTLSPSNPFTARNIASFIMQDRCRRFETRFHRPPSDQEFYILWARPSWYFTRHLRLSRLVDFELVAQRAFHFETLVNR